MRGRLQYVHCLSEGITRSKDHTYYLLVNLLKRPSQERRGYKNFQSPTGQSLILVRLFGIQNSFGLQDLLFVFVGYKNCSRTSCVPYIYYNKLYIVPSRS